MTEAFRRRAGNASTFQLRNGRSTRPCGEAMHACGAAFEPMKVQPVRCESLCLPAYHTIVYGAVMQGAVKDAHPT